MKALLILIAIGCTFGLLCRILLFRWLNRKSKSQLIIDIQDEDISEP